MLITTSYNRLWAWYPLILVCTPLCAQSMGVSSADLSGGVRLEGVPQGLPGAKLLLVNPATQETRITKTDAEGRFHFWILPAGDYLLLVEAEGCAPKRFKSLMLRLGTGTILDIELSHQAGTEVVVEAEISRMDPSRTQISQTIEPRLIEGLPIDRRSFESFSLTVPGVVVSNTPVTGGVPNSGLSFRGMNPRQNRFLVDGLDNTDLGTGAVDSALSQDAVQEFQVLTGGFSAEFGRASGGIVNSITKSGTNTFSGSTFLFYRPGQWDAKSQGLSTQDYRQIQYGASVGGALIPDRLFYFINVERFQKRDLNNVTIDRADALPAIQTAGFSLQDGIQSFGEVQTAALMKLDFIQSSDSKWGLRIIQGKSSNENQIPWGALNARSSGGTLDMSNSSLALTHQWLGGSNWVNEFRAIYARRTDVITSMDPLGTVAVNILGTAYFGTQRLTPQDTTSSHYQLIDTLTMAMGHHTWKVGLDLLHSRKSGLMGMNTAGVYFFDAVPGTPGSPAPLDVGFATPLDAFRAGFPAGFVQSWGNASTSFNVSSEALFVQDDWQIHPRLLIKLGLRYDRETLPVFEDVQAYESLGRTPMDQDPIYGPARLPDGQAAYSRLFEVQRDWSSSRVSPRLSLSWQIVDTLRTYGGYGVFSGNSILGPIFAARLSNDRESRTWIRTILDPPTTWPYLAWNNLDGAQNHRYADAPQGYTPTISIPGSYGMPETKAWNLGMEWNPGPEHRFYLEALGSRGKGFMNVRDVNAYVLYYNATLGVYVPRRPDRRFGSIYRIDGTGETRYLGQTLGWQWKRGEDLLLSLSYTHSKAEDNYIDITPDFPPQNTFDPGSEWGPSCENQTHQVLLSAVYNTRRWSSPWLKDWTFSIIARFASGRPYSRLVGYDQNLNGDGTSDRPTGVSRNGETTPATQNVDLRLSREFTLATTRLECLVEVFNFFNRTHVLKVQNVVSAPGYGSPVIFAAMRQIQFGLRYRF